MVAKSKATGMLYRHHGYIYFIDIYLRPTLQPSKTRLNFAISVCIVFLFFFTDLGVVDRFLVDRTLQAAVAKTNPHTWTMHRHYSINKCRPIGPTWRAKLRIKQYHVQRPHIIKCNGQKYRRKVTQLLFRSSEQIRLLISIYRWLDIFRWVSLTRTLWWRHRVTDSH